MPRNATDLKPRLLEEARGILVKEGKGGLTSRRVAKAAGCTAAALYLYFESMQDLIHALVDEGFLLLRGELEEAERDSAAAPMAALCRAYLDFALQNPEYYEVMFHLPPSQMGRYPVERYRQQRTVLELLGRAARGDAAPLQQRLRSATLIWGALHGAISLHLAERIDKSVRGKELLEDAIQVALAAAAIEPSTQKE